MTIDEKVNQDVQSILDGNAKVIIMGHKGMGETNDIQSVRYVAPVFKGCPITGYYKVTAARWKELPSDEYPIRIEFDVSDWRRLDTPARFGLVKLGYRGVCKSKSEFFRHCSEAISNYDLY